MDSGCILKEEPTGVPDRLDVVQKVGRETKERQLSSTEMGETGGRTGLGRIRGSFWGLLSLRCLLNMISDCGM